MANWNPLYISSADDRKSVALALFKAGYEVRESKRRDGNKTVVFVEYRERSAQ